MVGPGRFQNYLFCLGILFGPSAMRGRPLRVQVMPECRYQSVDSAVQRDIVFNKVEGGLIIKRNVHTFQVVE